MYFFKNLFLVVVLLGALKTWSAEGMTYRRIVRPPKQVETEMEHQHQHQPYPPQHPTIKPTHELSHYPPQSASPPVFPHEQPSQSGEHQFQQKPYHPQPYPTVVDEYDNRYPDGSYEYRYELSNESVRYECGYFIWVGQKKILAVKGFYSYRLPDKRYHTVFYEADQYGYRVTSSSFSFSRPVLPRSLSEDLVHSDGLRNFEGSTPQTVSHDHPSE